MTISMEHDCFSFVCWTIYFCLCEAKQKERERERENEKKNVSLLLILLNAVQIIFTMVDYLYV